MASFQAAIPNIPLAQDLTTLALNQLQTHASELDIDPMRQAQFARYRARLTPAVINSHQASQVAMRQHRRERSQLDNLLAKLRTYNNMLAPPEPITQEQKRKCLL
ncbi:hypothetical protein CEP53_007181 [Fusarium sp. AF-6]|nr:hypothetical protein CEP53_007181 [Fusarium sp. AF-6]